MSEATPSKARGSKKPKEARYYVSNKGLCFIAEDNEPIYFGVADVVARSCDVRFPTPSLQAKALNNDIESLMSFEDLVYTYSKTMRLAKEGLSRTYEHYIGE